MPTNAGSIETIVATEDPFGVFLDGLKSTEKTTFAERLNSVIETIGADPELSEGLQSHLKNVGTAYIAVERGLQEAGNGAAVSRGNVLSAMEYGASAASPWAVNKVKLGNSTSTSIDCVTTPNMQLTTDSLGRLIRAGVRSGNMPEFYSEAGSGIESQVYLPVGGNLEVLTHAKTGNVAVPKDLYNAIIDKYLDEIK